MLLDAVTGDVLALVSSPSFDPALFADRAHPGAVAGALGRSAQPADRQGDRAASIRPGRHSSRWSRWRRWRPGVITPRPRFHCPGYLELGDATFHCWQQGGHGALQSAGCDQEILRRLLLRDGAAPRHRSHRRDGAPLRLRRAARSRHPRRARRADPEPRLEAGDDRERLAAGRDADRRHRPGLGAGDAAADRDHGRAARHRPGRRAAPRRAGGVLPAGGDLRHPTFPRSASTRARSPSSSTG